MENSKLGKENLKKYGRAVGLWERLSLMIFLLIFWFLCKIRITSINPRLINLLDGVGRLKFEFPENVKEILRTKKN